MLYSLALGRQTGSQFSPEEVEASERREGDILREI